MQIQMPAKGSVLVGVAAVIALLTLLPAVGAETDTARRCAGIGDSRQAINKLVNDTLQAARGKVGNDGDKLIDEVYKALGEGLPWTMIEWWADRNLAIASVTQGDSKYSGVSSADARMWVAGSLILNPAIKVAGICIGTDKLGHFFQQGFQYYCTAVRDGKGESAAITWGEQTEAGGFGLTTTGVYSNADLAANQAGMDFYRGLKANPHMTFDIANCVTNNWNEESNPNLYTPRVGKTVWANLVVGEWTSALRTGPTTLHLQVSNFVDVTGTYEYSKGGTVATGAITGGKIKLITEKRHGVEVVIGIQIVDLAWKEGAEQGKASLTSLNESTITGTWNGSDLCLYSSLRGSPPGSTPPKILGIDFPSEIVGDGKQNRGEVRFRDADADVVYAYFDPVGGTGNWAPFDFAPGVIGKSEGAFDFVITCETSKAVTARFEVTLVDSAGKVSTPNYFSFTCVCPQSD